MENMMLFVKFLLFFGLEFTVVAIIGAVLVAGLYQIVRDKVRESRRQDQIAPENRSTVLKS
jgi:Na+-translocating ferredoxin:NAD+ oxidoreductase RnfG subunit